MNIIKNFKPILNFIYAKRKDFLSKVFWTQQIPCILNELIGLNKVSKEVFRKNLEILEARPLGLKIEFTNLCNANCIFCAYQYQTRPHEFMPDEIYYKIIDEYCLIGGGALLLSTIVGDPLLDKHFIKRIKYARSKSEITCISTITNCINLKEEEIKEIISSGINSILVSTAPWDKKLYEQIYRNKNYEKMRNNVKDLLEENCKSGNPVEIILGFRSNLSINETLSLPDYMAIKHLPHKVQFNAVFDTWSGKIKKEDLLPGMHIRPKLKLDFEPCSQLYSFPVILENGNVGLCACRDYNADSELIVGNIMDNSLSNIWKSKKVIDLRKRFYQGDFPNICKDCTMYGNLSIFRTKQETNVIQSIRK